MLVRRKAGRVIAAIVLMTAAGCQDTTEVDASAIAGAYHATTFTSVTGTTSTDELAAGATLAITLNVDGTTTGQLFLPAAMTGAGDRTESMAGTWALADRTVTFNQAADTFVRDMPFTVADSTNDLHGDQIFGNTRVIVTLRKQVVTLQ